MSGLRELMKRHGMDWDSIQDQGEFIDQETGKRMDIDHPTEIEMENDQQAGAKA